VAKINPEPASGCQRRRCRWSCNRKKPFGGTG